MSAAGRRLAIGALLLAIAHPAARAHRIEEAWTIVELNRRTGSLEIIHEIELHDLEHLMSDRKGRSVDLSQDGQALREAVAWLEEDFAIAKDGDPLNLKRVGAEIERNRLILYYEKPAIGDLPRLRVYDQMLVEAYPRQVNRVNVRIDGETRSLIFRRGDDWQVLELEPAP